MLKENIISIDCGTQSLRAVIFSKDGKILAKEQIKYAPYGISLKPGWAEQDVSVWWNALCIAVKNIRATNTGILENSVGIGITSQRDTIVLIDKDGNPLRPAITWLDTREAKGNYKPNIFMKAIYKILGVLDRILKMQKAGHINWIRENEPDIWKRTWKLLMVSGYFNYRLTGNPADSPSSLVGHLPFNHKIRNWGRKVDIVEKIFHIEKEKKCAVIESGSVIGHITQSVAEETGLPVGLPVISCGSDKACETIGMGCIDTSQASLSFGTTATVEVCMDKYIEPIKFMPAYSAACPGKWVPEIEIFRGYWMISWFKDELGYEERLKATETGIIPERILDKLLDYSEPGCNGLMLQPYWGASLKDYYAKGTIIGFGDVHGRHAIYRAIVEGLAYSLREGLETLEKRGSFKVKQIAVSGGASQSDRICQITADILNCPLLRGGTAETSALGAAILTAYGTGLYSSISESIENMIKIERTFMPNNEHRKLYDGLYSIYKKIYPALNGLYQEIQKVTGYPS